MSPRQIARDACGREAILRKLLSAAGATVTRTACHDTRGHLQIHVRLADGTLGFYNPGGPTNLLDYQWFEGHRPEDAEVIRADGPQGGCSSS